jgi:Zn ribbon nucleic-acid-binding protein
MSPIREFECPDGHITEKILFGQSDEIQIVCECTECGKFAKRQDISRPGAPILKEGSGGFYRPSREERK